MGNAHMPTPLEQKRISAIQSVRRGESPSGIAQRLGVSRQTVYRWLQRYSQEGETGLYTKSPRGPKHGWLDLEENQKAFASLADSTPKKHGIKGLVWSAATVARLLKNVSGHTFTEGTAMKYLARWGIFFPNPVALFGKVCPESMREWTRRHHSDLRRKARQKDKTLLWLADAKMGRSVVLDTSGRQFRAKAASMVILYAKPPMSKSILFSLCTHGDNDNYSIFIQRLLVHFNRTVDVIIGYGGFRSDSVLTAAKDLMGNHGLKVHVLPYNVNSCCFPSSKKPASFQHAVN